MPRVEAIKGLNSRRFQAFGIFAAASVNPSRVATIRGPREQRSIGHRLFIKRWRAMLQKHRRVDITTRVLPTGLLAAIRVYQRCQPLTSIICLSGIERIFKVTSICAGE